MAGESELWPPLPNVLSGVRLEREGSGSKPETDEESAALDWKKMSCEGVTSFRNFTLL